MDLSLSSTVRPAHPRRTARCVRAGALAALALTAAGLGSQAKAQSSGWDAVISNSYWYVPVPQLLAYAAPASSFANPIPIGDQTLWALGTSTNGVFTGTSTAQLAIGPVISNSATTIQGRVTPAGQITMLFTPVGGGVATIGIGLMQNRGGVTEMEMQMITGSELLVTHWAYMVPYNPATFTPPAPQAIPLNLSSRQWSWTEGTPWRIVSPSSFGTAAPGKFIITNYTNGYFWGQGVTPTGGSFTLLGSITPEGKVLFNSISAGTLSSLYGDITGDAATAQMALDSYSLSGADGALTFASVVAPYANTTSAMNNTSAYGAARALYAIAGTPTGLTGPMAPAIDALNALQGAALSTAVSQTVPALAGAATQATWAAQQAYQQTVRDRLDLMGGLAAAGGPEAAPTAWVKPFGGLASQGSRNGVPGYDLSGGGVAAGLDREIAPGFWLGGAAGYGYSSVSLASDQISNGLSLNSYYVSLYARYALAPATFLDVQLDGAYNRNAESRTIGFMTAGAGADYGSYGGHAGVSLTQVFTLSPLLQLAPALRLDYANVAAPGYGETGAGALNLTVGAQNTDEMRLTAQLGGQYRLSDHVRLTAKAGVGYDFLNSQNEITAAYQGGGSPFVTYGASLSPWLLTGGLGLVGFQADALELGIHYDLQASPSGFLNQMSSVQLKVRL